MPISIPLQLKRTTSSNRLSYTPVNGEPIIEQDTAKIYVGDGITPGGVAVDGISIPAGSIFMFPTDNPPTGFLECDGSAISRTTYADLFAFIGISYGSGDGTTTFNIPDYRGTFLRSADHGAGIDPDSLVRQDRGDGTIGDFVGTTQPDIVGNHEHNLHTNGMAGGVVGPTQGGLHAGGGKINSGTTPKTGMGSETRPKNISVLCCIAY